MEERIRNDWALGKWVGLSIVDEIGDERRKENMGIVEGSLNRE